jgi:hypothetical protein
MRASDPSPTILRLSERQRDDLIDKLPDTANLALGGMLFAQFVGGQIFSTVAALAGAAVWMVLMGSSIMLAKGGWK